MVCEVVGRKCIRFSRIKEFIVKFILCCVWIWEFFV